LCGFFGEDSDVEWEDNCSDEGDVVAEEENRDEDENNSSIPTKVTEKERIAGHRRISEVDSETAEELLRVARSAMPFAMNIDLARGSVSSSHGGDAGSSGLVVSIAIKELYQQLRAVDFPRLKVQWHVCSSQYVRIKFYVFFVSLSTYLEMEFAFPKLRAGGVDFPVSS
jgi:hypothetical protein